MHWIYDIINAELRIRITERTYFRIEACVVGNRKQIVRADIRPDA
jgi:hypothetical protein